MKGETYFIIALLFLFFVAIPAFFGWREYQRAKKCQIDPEEVARRKFFGGFRTKYKKGIPKLTANGEEWCNNNPIRWFWCLLKSLLG